MDEVTFPTTFPFPGSPPPGNLGEANELTWLLRAERAGLPVTPMVVVPVAVETGFYALNNLAEQLQRHFDGLISDDPDEDDLDEVVPEAIALVRGHALLDEVIERLYDAFTVLPDEVIVRRAGTTGTATRRGRAALLEIKRVWAAEWETEAVAARLRAGAGLAPVPSPVLVHDARVSRLRETLGFGPDGAALEAWHDGDGRLARLALAVERA